MKKTIVLKTLALALLLIFSLAACGPAAPDETVREPDAPAEAPAEKTAFKVGVIYGEDHSADLMHEIGIEAMASSLGLSDGENGSVSAVHGVSSAEAVDEAVASLAGEGCGIIFCTNKSLASELQKQADGYPDVIFAAATDGKKSSSAPENFHTYSGRIYQAFYLSGIAAAMKSESGLVGFVAPKDGPLSSVNAFAMGVSRINPDIRVCVKVTNSRYDPEQERAAAEALLDMGCDVMAQSCLSSEPLLAAAEREVWACGCGNDVPDEAKGVWLTSPNFNWGVYYTRATKAAMEKTELEQDYYGGMNDGLVELTSLSSNCASETRAEVKAAKDEILAGTDVFDREITDNGGNLVNPEGEKLSRREIIDMNWYYRNIELW